MAQAADISQEIEALAVHCRMPLMDVTQRAMWMRDWCSDLAQFEIEHVRRAFRDWRLSGNTKFPTPGQLLPLVRSAAPRAKEPENGPWRELSEAAYQALDLPSKVRHHLIMANQALNRAGPMWKNGKPAAAESMPASWHEWRARAENHRDEAHRLNALLRRQDLSA